MYKNYFLIRSLSDLTDSLSSNWCCMALSNQYFLKSLNSKLLMYDAPHSLQNVLAFDEFRVMS